LAANKFWSYDLSEAKDAIEESKLQSLLHNVKHNNPNAILIKSRFLSDEKRNVNL